MAVGAESFSSANCKGVVLAVARKEIHAFSKTVVDSIQLIANMGVEGDAHSGKTVKHRSRVKTDPAQPNLRQVHLLHAELLAELAEQGFAVRPADLGENVTTRGINLLGLPTGTRLVIGDTVELEITGLRNPCAQIEAFQQGLLSKVVDKDANGHLVRKAGVMAIVRHGGTIRASDAIRVLLPPMPHVPLDRV